MRISISSGMSLLIGFAAIFSAGLGVAQDFPSKPIRMIIPDNPGVIQDSLARAVAPEMSRLFGQPVIIENRPGADQSIGLEFTTKQIADGYAIASVSATGLASQPIFVKELRFDPLKDLPPIIGVATSTLALVSSPKMPWTTFNEMINYAKANPGKLNFGSSSPQTRLPMLAILVGRGVDIVYIPYSTGAGYIQGLVAADTGMGFISLSTATASPDKFRTIAITGDQRSSLIPNVPTFPELGLPQITGLRYTFNGPVGIPKSVSDKIFAVTVNALQNQEVKARFAKLQLNIIGDSAEVEARKLAEDGKNFADIARQIGVRP